jgi:hypothetical protein
VTVHAFKTHAFGKRSAVRRARKWGRWDGPGYREGGKRNSKGGNGAVRGRDRPDRVPVRLHRRGIEPRAVAAHAAPAAVSLADLSRAPDALTDVSREDNTRRTHLARPRCTTVVIPAAHVPRFRALHGPVTLNLGGLATPLLVSPGLTTVWPRACAVYLRPLSRLFRLLLTRGTVYVHLVESVRT